MRARLPAMFACCAALALAAPPAAAGWLAVGTVVDPAGDAVGGVPPDIVWAGIAVGTTHARFSVTFQPGTSLGDASAIFVLDTDQDAATGFPGIDAANNDSALIGAEFMVQLLGSDFQGAARILSGDGLNVLGTAPVTYSGTTEYADVPLSLLGDDDGLMNFKVVAQQQLGTLAFHPITDYASDVGLAAGVVAVPAPAAVSLLGLGLGLLVGGRRAARSA